MKWITWIGILLVVPGCASNSSLQESVAAGTPEVVTLQKEFPPQVWSDHKELNISESACSEKGAEVLDSLGFIQIVKSSHGEYVYGNYSNNRAAIKCVSVSGQTFLYAIVAGPKRAVVEKFRNEIMWQF